MDEVSFELRKLMEEVSKQTAETHYHLEVRKDAGTKDALEFALLKAECAKQALQDLIDNIEREIENG
jgi:hypothetical protein